MPSVRKTPARRRGRPAAAFANPDRRGRLLDVAIELFVERGIADTPLNAIAKRAGVTPALMHYYFRNRDRLVDAFLDERLIPLLDSVWQQVDTRERDPRRIIPALARNMIRFMSETPWLPPIWIREIVGAGGVLRERLMARVGPTFAQRIRGVIEEGQRRGLIDRAIESRLMIVSVVGLAVLPVAMAPMWRRIPGNEHLGTEDLMRHVTALLEHGMGIPND